MIKTEIVDLYQKYGVAPQGAKGGSLMSWIWRTPVEISPSRCRPAVLILPGGGYEKVSPREAEPVAMRFLVRGYNAFVLNYSVAPSTFPTALREGAMALRYIRENAGEMDVDPTMVAVIGFSAGGHLCGCLGTMYDCPEVSDIAPPEVLRPDALGLCYPVAVSWGSTHEGSFRNLTGGDAALRQRMSLEGQVRRDMPPVFLWHTRDDGSVPVRNSLILANALEAAGVDFALHIYRSGRHGLSVGDGQCYPLKEVPKISEDIREWPEKMMQFFGECGFTMTDREEEHE